MEQTLDALVIGVERGEDFLALVRVAEELVDGFLQGVLNAGTLELGNHQRDAVHK